MIEDDFSFWWLARSTQLLIRLQKATTRVAKWSLAVGSWFIALGNRLDPGIKRRCAEMEWVRDRKQVEIDRLRTELGLLHEKKEER